MNVSALLYKLLGVSAKRRRADSEYALLRQLYKTLMEIAVVLVREGF